MRLVKKIKLLFILIIFILSVFGFFYIKDAIVDEKKDNVKKEENRLNDKDKENISGTIRELEKCQAELFSIKNVNENLKVMPDARKNIIELLLTLRKMEKKIGIERDFSNDCVRLFATASHIPNVQDFALKYKEKMFNNMCQVATHDDVVNLVVPFQMKFIEMQYENKNANKPLFKRILEKIKQKASQIFVRTKIEQSEIEKKVLNKQYEDALKLLENSNIKEQKEYEKLYSSIEGLYLLQNMIDNIYKIVQDIN